MKMLIIGGGALGAQAVMLAKAAGFYTILGDKDPACSAASMADEFVCLNGAGDALPPADFVLPALEAEEVLKNLPANALFDAASWELTASRLRADAFLQERGIPVPEYFPMGSEPYIVKPDRGSFGRGIWVTEDFCEVGGAVNAGFVTQEELNGPVWSQVVVGKEGNYTAYAPAKLSFNAMRLRTGAECVPSPEAEALKKTAVAIAEAMDLRGILEVEAIWHGGVWKVVDLNARLPMHTGEALLKTGVNLVSEMVSRA